MWSSYQEMYMNIDNEKLLVNKRLEMVRFANEVGIKKAARFYDCSKNTIKKWCRRYALNGLAGLLDKSRKPNNSPKKIKQEDIDNLKPYFACNKNNYKGIKVKYQITYRDVCTGLAIVCYCDEKSTYYTTKATKEILYPFLKQFKGLNLKDVTIQTDNGTENTNRMLKSKGKEPEKSTFTKFVEEKFKKHKLNIPGHCTANSEVESFHWSIERDCLAWEDIIDNDTLIMYTTKYMNEYIHSEIKIRGYSPIDKIKEAYDIDNIIYPMPQILNV